TNAVWLSTRITAGGSVISAGRFLDGRAFTASGILASTGDHPFYLSCRKGAEAMIGWLNFQPPTPDIAPVGGSLAWVNTGTNGFAVTLTP
ncbi:MAG TPA: hypothetical protein VN673_09990, partial [Clostridia bacterium]|nr:hypothetical protein [Clostridia bacterium]